MEKVTPISLFNDTENADNLNYISLKKNTNKHR